ncbi:unnamed protein product [Paramecium sonneborni]|uniref:Protein kinase domain-containing protein n=1 Tax=Paramecium sonneborni TaxID=65129 RepID=A0A8S1P7R9_9CILI|nr:unnamed protein product [Paramecium sonneborni]
MNELNFQFSHSIQDLNQTQINQVESLIQNLPDIKNDSQMFPQDLIIEKKDHQYYFGFELQAKSLLSNKSQICLMQEIGYPYHYSKHLLRLLIKLQKYNIYLPTLKQDSFINIDQGNQLSQQHSNESPIKVQQFVLYQFGLEKLEQNSQALISNYCLSPEFKEALNCENNYNKIHFTEKMAIFNTGCILFELYTKHQLYDKETSKYNLTKYMFKKLEYESFLFGQLVQKCTLVDEQESNKRLTFQEALSQLNYIDQCVQIIKIAEKQQKQIDFDLFFSLDSSLYEQLNLFLKYKCHHQMTGRLFIMQNLSIIKFIYILFKEEDHFYFRNFLILKLIMKELLELKELKDTPYEHYKSENTILNFNDSEDEIREFLQNYSQKYTELLYQLIIGILEKEKQNRNKEQAKRVFKKQFSQSQLQDFQQEFHANLFPEKTPQQQLHKLCLANIQKVFNYNNLMHNFQPIFLQLIRDHHCYEIYDHLLKVLFQDVNQHQIQKIIAAIRNNVNN